MFVGDFACKTSKDRFLRWDSQEIQKRKTSPKNYLSRLRMAHGAEDKKDEENQEEQGMS